MVLVYRVNVKHCVTSVLNIMRISLTIIYRTVIPNWAVECFSRTAVLIKLPT